MNAPQSYGGGEIADVLRRLGDPSAVPAPGLIERLSGATSADVATFRAIWPEIAPERRRWLVRALVESAEADFRVEFRALFTAMLDDADPAVRADAIDGLWEVHEAALLQRFTDMMTRDDASPVRARAAAALGGYIEQAELGRFPADALEGPIAALLSVAAGSDVEVEVRRRAVESLGYADYSVSGSVIADALASPERPMQAGAMRAIGRSADDRWAPEVLAELDGADAEVRFEAVRAAGELTLAEAVPQLIAAARDGDREIQLEAIWSLGEIGGKDARRALDRLLRDAEDDDLSEAIEDAQASAALGGDDLWFGRS